jgi:small GTP-binding protein
MFIYLFSAHSTMKSPVSRLKKLKSQPSKSDRQMTSYDFMFKLLIVGESSVGKTCMLLRFADNLFESDFLSTIGVDFKVKEISVDSKRVKLQIWDSAGQERFRNITSSYYRNSSGIIIVYDVTNMDSFEKVVDWIQEVRRYVPTVPLIIVGNKSDLVEERQVSTENGEELAQRQGLIFLETSAKTNTNIEAAFERLSKKLIEMEATRPGPPGGGRGLVIDRVPMVAQSSTRGSGCFC